MALEVYRIRETGEINETAMTTQGPFTGNMATWRTAIGIAAARTKPCAEKESK
jgi:hypothetical protein